MFKGLIIAIGIAVGVLFAGPQVASADVVIQAGVGAGIECAKQVRIAYPFDTTRTAVGKGNGQTVYLISFEPAKLRALLEARCYIAMIEIGLSEGWYRHSQPYLHMGDSRTDYQILLDFESWMLGQFGEQNWYCLEYGEPVSYGGYVQAFRECVVIGSEREAQLRLMGWLP